MQYLDHLKKENILSNWIQKSVNNKKFSISFVSSNKIITNKTTIKNSSPIFTITFTDFKFTL